MELDQNTAVAFVLVLARTSGWTLAVPLLTGISAVGRLAVALGLAIFITPLASSATTGVPSELHAFVMSAAIEVAIGLTLGWLVALVLSAASVSGSLIDLFGGFAAATVLDPGTTNQTALFGRLNSFAMTIFILVTPAWHGLIRGFVSSYSRLPLGESPAIEPGAASTIGSTVGGVLVSAVLIAAPALAALLVAEAALAVVSRLVPQANVFYLGLPIKAFATVVVVNTCMVLIAQRLPVLIDIADDLSRRIIG